MFELRGDKDQLNQELNLFQSGPVMVFKWQNQQNWPVEYVSRNIQERLGYTVEEFTQGVISYPEIIHPEDLARFRDEVVKGSQSQTEHFSHKPYRLLHQDGRFVWVDDHTIILRDNTGNITHYLGYLIDITSQKATEESLRKSEERLNLILKGSDLGIWDCEVQTGVTIFNQRWAEMLGYHIDEIKPHVRSWRNLLHPEDKAGVLAALNDHLDGRTPFYQSEHRLKTKSGAWLWVMDHGKIVEYDAQGLPSRSAGIQKNIDIRKRAEDAVRLSNERFKTVLNSIDACIFVADINTHEILFMNQNMIESFCQDHTGELCWKVFRKEGRPCKHCNNSLLLNEEGQPSGVQSWHGLNPITGKNYMNYDRAIHWTADRIAKIQIATDITELKALEMQLRQKYKMEAVGLMAGGVAHNFNNSLAIILDNIKLSQMNLPEDNAASNYLENAYKIALRSGDLIKQILAYSRTGEHNHGPVQLAQVVKDTIRLLRSTIPTTVNLRPTISTDNHNLTINADSSQLQEILINLCTNAVHAMNEKGTLIIVLDVINLKPQDIPAQYERAPGPYAMLKVQDNGTGITPEIMEKIFDPFFTTKEVNQGTGMGLSTVQGIMDQHLGLIKVRSIPGEGSTFELYFPVIANQTAERSPAPQTLPKGRERILFLDDDEMLANVGGQMLSEFGYKVTTETSSVHALELFKTDPHYYDLVITDQTMPDLSGKDLLIEMFAIRPNLPAIMCTGFSNKIDADEAKGMGIKAFFIKPLDLPELINTTRRILDESKIE